MWKVNLGFALALAALGLCALGTYDTLKQLRATHDFRDKEADDYFQRGCEIIAASGVLSVIVTGLSVVFINRDVRGRQEAEVELAVHRDNLEARVKERTADLARANEALQKAHAGLEVRVRERTADL